MRVAREPRKLAAILAADVVGYSRLIGRDESGILTRLREHRYERLAPPAARFTVGYLSSSGDDPNDANITAASFPSPARRARY
jgi:class 3 adenylate cyclase